jgi:hypothetical protein
MKALLITIAAPEGFWSVNRRFYSLGSILRRAGRAPASLLWELPLNLLYAARWRRYPYGKS